MLNRAQKEKIVEELADKLKRRKIAIFSDVSGISVAKSQALRRQLTKDSAEFKMAKKTLFDIALDKAGSEFRTKNLKGEIGLTIGYADETSPAKTLVKFGKANETFKILGAILGNKAISDKDVVKLSKLPAKEVLLAQFLGVMQSPMRNLLRVLNGNTKNLIMALNKIKDKK